MKTGQANCSICRRLGVFPKWTGLVVMAGTVILLATPLLGLPTLLLNVSNIVLASIFIHLCFTKITPTAEIISERR